MPITITGLRQTSAAYAKLDRELRAEFRSLERDVAEPVQRTAEALGQARITRIGNRWWKMRIGVTRSVIYVAPKERGVRGAGDNPRRRRKFAKTLMDEAMAPALEQNEAKIEHAVELLLDHICDDFNR